MGSERRRAITTLSLLDRAAELGSPLIGCHGAVGRLRAISGQAKEGPLQGEEVSVLPARAENLGMRIALEDSTAMSRIC